MITNPLLKTYWIGSPEVHLPGFGVTAFSREDAFQLLSASGYTLLPDDPTIRITEGIQVADLDQNHIIPNMGPIVFRAPTYERVSVAQLCTRHGR